MSLYRRGNRTRMLNDQRHVITGTAHKTGTASGVSSSPSTVIEFYRRTCSQMEKMTDIVTDALVIRNQLERCAALLHPSPSSQL